MKLAFLDMDGVIADFVSGICSVHNRPYLYDDPKAAGIWDMEKVYGMSVEDFWRPSEYPGFWRGLQKTENADAIVEAVIRKFGINNVAILTAPADSPYCIPEKKEWLAANYPQFKDVIFTHSKRFLAGPDRYLIDDRDKNIEDFRAAGGVGLIVPRPWNKWHMFSGTMPAVEAL